MRQGGENMQLKIKEKVVLDYSWKKLIYTLCFAMFCLIDQRSKTCSGLDGWLETFRSLTGVVMAIIIMSHYRWDSLRKHKIPYLVWTAISIVGGVVALWWGKNNYYFFNDWIVRVIDVILFGYIIIYTFIRVVVEKKYPKLNKKFAIVWLIMMLLMIVSRSTYIWPFGYFVMFGCFYLTDYSKEEQTDLFQGMLNGIILGFFLMQGWCFVFRPFDNWDYRYVGIYNNCNLNALFYLMVLAAVFAKIIYVNRVGAGKLIRVYYWVGAGVVLSFLFLTIGRTAWMTAFVLGIIFLISLRLVQRKKRIILNGIILILCMCLTFPVCFGAVRYLPPVFHHPVWFWGEWSDNKVHSWDPADSSKYVDFDEFMDRVGFGFSSILGHSPFAIKSQAAEASVDDRYERAIFKEKGIPSALVARKTIYQQYFKNLNLWGHPYEEQGFQMTPTYWVGHAHNIYLQYGTDFGIVVMFLFVLLILWAAIIYIKRVWKKCFEEDVASLLFLTIPATFGMLEYAWGVGSVAILMLFVVWRKAFLDEER